MGVGDWLRRFVPFRKRRLSDPTERAQAIRDAVELCRKRREKAGDPPNLEETDAVFDELVEALEEQGEDPWEVWWSAYAAYPDNVRWLEALAARALAGKNTDRETRDILRRQSERDPENLPLLLRLIECYRAEGDDYMEAHLSSRVRQIAQRLLQLPPGAPLPAGITHRLCDALVENLSQRLAEMYLNMGREDAEALELYQWMLDRDITQSGYLGVVSRHYIQQRRSDPQALEILESSLAFNPEDVTLRRYLAELYLENPARVSEGLLILRKMAQNSPPDAEAGRMLLSFLRVHPELWSTGDIKMLIAHARSHPEDTALTEALAIHHAVKEDLGEDAREIYRLAIAANLNKSRYLRLLAGYHAGARQWIEVEKLLEEVVRLDGAIAPDVLTPLATAYSELGREHEHAIEAYRAAARAGSTSPRIHEALCHHLYLHKRTDEEALQEFRRTLDLVPSCRWASLGLIQGSLATKNYSLAFEESLALLKQKKTDPEARQLVARALAHEPNPRLLAQLADLGDAMQREILWEAYREKPSSRPIVLHLAQAEVRLGNREARIIPVLRSAMHIEPDDMRMASALSEILWRAGREEEAAEVDAQTLSWVNPVRRRGRESQAEATPDDRTVAARQAATRLSAYYARHNITTPEALRVLWQALDLGVCADEAIVFLARHLIATQASHRRAEEVILKAQKLLPHDPVLQIALFRAQIERGDVQNALRYSLDQLKTSPTRRLARDLLREALQHARKQDFAPALLGQLRTLCSSNPDDAELAELAARAHQIAEVINPQVRAIFEKALAGKPRDPALLINLANSCREAGELNKAIDFYSSALELDPENAEAMDHLARLFAQTHCRTPRAAAILRRVLARRPEDPELQLLDAELRIEEGKASEAFGILRQLLKNHPGRGAEILGVAERSRVAPEQEPERMMLLARLYTVAERADDALDTLGLLQTNHQPGLSELLPAYDTLIRHFPEHVRARVERAILYKLAGQYEMALSDLDAIAENADQAGSTPNILSELAEVLELHLARQKDPKPEILLKLGRLQQQLGETKGAARTYKRILERDPGNQEAHLVLARSFITQGQLDAAREHLRACAAITPEVLATQGDLARSLERLGRWDQAIEVLQSAGTEQEPPAEHRLLLARLQQRARQETTAKQAKSFLGELPDAIRQRYELLQQISREGEKIVFRAYDREKNEVLAIKLFPPWILQDDSAREQFRARAEAVRKLLHPNIVALLDAGLGPTRPYAMLEYVTGGDLRTRLRRARGPLSIPEVRRLAQALAEAFAFAHSKQIIHGMLRPSRILVTLDGRIKVAAFLSAGLPPAPSAYADEKTLAPGAEDYRSPEQLERPHATSASTIADDVYAYGGVLYHAVTGQSPTVGMTTAELAKNPTSGQALLRVGPALSALIMHCLQGEAADRPPSYGAILDMLKGA